MTNDDIIHALRNISPGKRIVYFTGFVGGSDYLSAVPVFAAARRAYVQGYAILIQRRANTIRCEDKEYGSFEYIAIGARQEQPRRRQRARAPDRSYIQCSLENPE